MTSRNTQNRRSSLVLLPFVLAGIMLTSGLASAEDDAITRFAASLASLRQEVETLSSEVESAKEGQRQSLRSYAAQKTDLELQIQRENRRIQQLQAQTTKETETVTKLSRESQALKPVVKKSLNEVRKQIEVGLPFKRGERLAALTKIEEQFEQGLSSPEKTSARLWAMIQDEMRLTRENGLYRQTINIEGQESLVEVARLGMVAMYFRTNDGRVGKTIRSESGWGYELIEDDTQEDQVEALFDAFKKQIRVGYFQLPNPLR